LKAVRGKTLDFQTPLPSILQSITFQDAENEFAISRGSPTNQNLYLRRGPPLILGTETAVKFFTAHKRLKCAFPKTTIFAEQIYIKKGKKSKKSK